MLGFRALSEQPISSDYNNLPPIAAAAQMLSSVTQSAPVTHPVLASATQTLATITQATSFFGFMTATQTLAPISATTPVVVKLAVRSDATLDTVIQTAALTDGTTASAGQTLGALTSNALARVYWNLPDSGWIGTAGQAVDSLLKHLPMGAAWRGFRTAGKVFNSLAIAFGHVLDDMTAALANLSRELDPRTCVDMMPEWETALSLPDACLPAANTIDQRRANVLFRLAKRRWTTAQDWKDLAGLFGLTIDVTPGWYVQRTALYGSDSGGFKYFTFPLRFDLFPRLGRFRVYIDVTNVNFTGFEYGGTSPNSEVGFPIPFGETNATFLKFQCILERVCPANVVIIWNEFPKKNKLID